MRKDVKLGFAVGGVLLAVLIVYVSVMGRANRPATNQPGAITSVAGGGSNASAQPSEPAATDPFSAQASNQPTQSEQPRPDAGMNWETLLLAGGPVASRTPEATLPAPTAAPVTPQPT